MAKGFRQKSFKKRIEDRYQSVKQNIKEHIKIPYLLIGVLFLIIIALFALGIKFPFADENMSAIVDKRAITYVTLYHGIVNVTINNKTLEGETWKVNLNGYASDGIVNLDLELDAKDFSITKITQTLNMPSKPNTIRFLNKTMGCSIGDMITVDIYIDPYDPWSIKYDSVIRNFTERFKKSMLVTYRILSTYSYQYISRNASSDAYVALKYYECAKDKPYFQSFKECVIDRYSSDKEFLNETELLSCISLSGGNKDEIAQCTKEGPVLSNLATNQRFAETFLGTATTPMIVIDCRYSTYPLFAEYVFCYLYPKNEECKE